MALTSINPATGEVVAQHEEHHPAEIQRRLARAGAAVADWRERPFAERASCLRAVAQQLKGRSDACALHMAVEMGKPVTQGRAEIAKCAWACEWFAEHAERLLAPETVASDALRSMICFRPLGVVLAVMPWNFPFWQVIRCAAPALMAGNTIALKHAGNVTGCALALEFLFAEAGAPAGVFETLVLPSARLGEAVDHPAVRGIALTGSTAAGRAVAAAAGARLKPTVLELGGSDPYLVLEDADLAQAARVCAAARLINSGQSCIAAKRFIVLEPQVEAFTAALTDAMRHAVVGNPLEDATTVGPLARTDLRDELHDQVRRTLAAGARRVLGGEVPAGPGWFYPPTVLAGVRPGMAAGDEETFGPVAAVLAAADEAEAVRLANASPFGLGAAVFTADRARGERLAGRLEAGTVFINEQVRSDPRLPFGGVKESGYGRELGAAGLREFTNVQTVWVA